MKSPLPQRGASKIFYKNSPLGQGAFVYGYKNKNRNVWLWLCRAGLV